MIEKLITASASVVGFVAVAVTGVRALGQFAFMVKLWAASINKAALGGVN